MEAVARREGLPPPAIDETLMTQWMTKSMSQWMTRWMTRSMKGPCRCHRARSWQAARSCWWQSDLVPGKGRAIVTVCNSNRIIAGGAESTRKTKARVPVGKNRRTGRKVKSRGGKDLLFCSFSLFLSLFNPGRPRSGRRSAPRLTEASASNPAPSSR